MPTYRTNVGSGRTVTLPADLCRRLKIKDGTPVEFFLTIDGQVHFHAITGSARGFGGQSFEKRSPPISVREMDDAIAEYVVEDHDRILRQSEADRPRGKRPAAE